MHKLTQSFSVEIQKFTGDFFIGFIHHTGKKLIVKKMDGWKDEQMDRFM